MTYQTHQRHFSRGELPSQASFPAYLYPSGSYALDGIATRAGGLGMVFALAMNTAWTWRYGFPQLPLFVACLAFFHFMEFWITARYNTRRGKVEAFILTSNGAAYNIAHASAIVEALVEYYFFPQLKAFNWVTVIGLFLVIIGQTARTLAMKHAGSNFSHYVVTEREAGHRLVTEGIYAWLRHPSYFGYYWWAVGTQVMLGNPICTLGFAAFLWMFFSNRVKHEEEYLISFFREYSDYRKRSWVGIPFIG
ncbi:prenylcystein carboxymethyl transferase [Pyronema omphalodes]|nr:prenylcystein carboxymethyl transferase [Pyronema omphalodes]